MNKMQALMKKPREMGKWFDGKRKDFEAL